MMIKGVELESMYIPLHLRNLGVPFLQGNLEVSEDIYPLVLNIPVRPNLSNRQVLRIANAIHKFGVRYS